MCFFRKNRRHDYCSDFQYTMKRERRTPRMKKYLENDLSVYDSDSCQYFSSMNCCRTDTMDSACSVQSGENFTDFHENYFERGNTLFDNEHKDCN